MSENVSSESDMVVVMRTHRYILVPPFELARDVMREDESPEQAAMRISRGYGPKMDIDKEIQVPRVNGAPAHAYLVENYPFLTRSEFLVHHNEVPKAVEAHSYLTDIEKQLLISAANLLKHIK